MSRSGERRFTRRQLIVGGVGGAAAVVAAGYGRFAIGDEFEEHLASVLGTSVPVATELIRGARERLGERDYKIKAAQFVAVTAFPTGEVVPSSARRRAVYQLFPSLLEEPRENLIYLGVRKPGVMKACAGLVRI